MLPSSPQPRDAPELPIGCDFNSNSTTLRITLHGPNAPPMQERPWHRNVLLPKLSLGSWTDTCELPRLPPISGQPDGPLQADGLTRRRGRCCNLEHAKLLPFSSLAAPSALPSIPGSTQGLPPKAFVFSDLERGGLGRVLVRHCHPLHQRRPSPELGGQHRATWSEARRFSLGHCQPQLSSPPPDASQIRLLSARDSRLQPQLLLSALDHHPALDPIFLYCIPKMGPQHHFGKELVINQLQAPSQLGSNTDPDSAPGQPSPASVLSQLRPNLTPAHPQLLVSRT